MRSLPRLILFLAVLLPLHGAPENGRFVADREVLIKRALQAFSAEVDEMKPRFPELVGWGDPAKMSGGDDWLYFDAGAGGGEKPGKGLFLRFYVLGAPDTSGERGKRFPIKTSGGLYLGVSGSLQVEGAGELADALSEAYLKLRTKLLNPGLARAVLLEAGVSTDVPSLLSAAELSAGGDRWIDELVASVPYQRGFRPSIGRLVFDVLTESDQVLTADQLSTVWRALCERRYPPDAWSGAVKLLRTRDADNWPARSAAVVRMLIDAEKTGQDRFEATPFFGAPWSSTVQSLRWSIAVELGDSSDTRYAETFELIIKEDPNLEGRLRAMKWLASTDSSEARRLVLETLGNDYRSVVVLAAKLAVNYSDERMAGMLRKLAVSPVVRVREAVATALIQMGEPVPALPAEFSLPVGAVKLVNTLNGLGLDDATMLKVFSQPEDISPPRRNGEGKVVWDRLEDPWRLSLLDEASITKRTAQYAAGFGHDRTSCEIDATGPYLLVVAERLGGSSPRLVYQAMGENFESDEIALQRGVDYLAWTVFLDGLDAFQFGRDDVAKEAFERMERFAGFAGPYSKLSVWLKQSQSLLAELERRRLHPTDGPEPDEPQAAVAYWIARLPEINGIQPGQPAQPSIWESENRHRGGAYAPMLPFASDRLRALGRLALPALVECVADETPTRTIGYHRDFFADRYWVTKGQVAQNIIQGICKDEGIALPFDWQTGYRGDPAKLATIWGDWLAGLEAAR